MRTAVQFHEQFETKLKFLKQAMCKGKYEGERGKTEKKKNE